MSIVVRGLITRIKLLIGTLISIYFFKFSRKSRKLPHVDNYKTLIPYPHVFGGLSAAARGSKLGACKFIDYSSLNFL